MENSMAVREPSGGDRIEALPMSRKWMFVYWVFTLYIASTQRWGA
jgi:hypothetical protein